jgi:hypothetical protein
MTGEEDRQNQQRGGEAVVAGNKLAFGGESSTHLKASLDSFVKMASHSRSS